MYDNDLKMWNHIFSSEPAIDFKSAPFGVILPHNMIVGYELTKFYKGLVKVTNPSVVVVISPNHYENGDPDIQTCQNCSYETINGILPLQTDLIQKMVQDGIAAPFDNTFTKEHGIYNHAPYIRKFFPQAKLVPITLKWETTQEDTVKLSKWLSANLPEDSLVIGSVDFSHYIPLEAASFHDIASYSTIKNFDYGNMYDLEIDSPPSISTITHLMEERGFMDAQRFQHTNNQDYHAERVDSTTSHEFIAFFKGQKQPEKSLTIMSFGNIADSQSIKNNTDSGLKFYDNYRWNINAANPNTEINEYLRDIRGYEDRYLVGADFVVFDLPKNSCQLHEQNGLHISFCEFNQNGQIAEQFKTVQQQKTQGADYIYLLYRFNDLKFIKQDEEIARMFADHGVSIFIGRGLKTVIPVENYKNSIITYSLGDFITEPSVKKSDGEILEIALTPADQRTFTFPIQVVNGYPKLITQPLDPHFQK